MGSLDHGLAMDLTPREHLDRYVAAVNAADWDAVRDLLGPDMRAVDHRPIGWEETVGREASMAIIEAWAELSPGFQLSVQLLAAGSHANVARSLYHGVAEHGVKWENEYTRFRGSRRRADHAYRVFPGDDAGSALALFEDFEAQTA